MESLKDCPTPLMSLGGKIAMGTHHALRSSQHLGAKLIDQNVNLRKQETLKGYRTALGGRQGAFPIAMRFTRSDNSESFLGSEHASAIEMTNNDLETFWITWRRIEGQLRPLAVTPKGESLLYRCANDSQALRTVIVEHDRSSADSPERSYEWLEKEMELAVDRIRRKKNYTEKEQGLADISRPAKPKKLHVASASEEQPRSRS